MQTEINVLVTGTGGGVGQSLLKCLHGSRFRAVAADAEPLATGLYAAQRGYLIPYARDPLFIPELLRICRAEDCSLLFPGLDAELGELSRARQKFQDAGVTVVVSSPPIVALSDDKLATAAFLAQHGFPAPITVPLSAEERDFPPLPVVLKPRRGGARSQGVYVVTTWDELRRQVGRLNRENYVVQEYIDGDEYTCGSVSFGGQCRGVIVMKRILRDGDTYKAFVVRDPALERFATAVLEALQPFGPCNLQFRTRGGQPYLLEINARCSGTSYCRALAGFNEPLMTAEYLLGGVPPSYEIRPISVLRYWAELPVSNDQIDTLESDRSISGTGRGL